MGKLTKRAALSLLCILLILGVGGYIGWMLLKDDLEQPDSKVEQKLSEQFAEMITEASDSLYRVSYTKFDLSLDSGTGKIRDFKITPDLKVLERLTRSERAPNNVLQMAVKELTLSNLKLQRTSRGLRMNIGSILIDSTDLRVTNTLRRYNINGHAEKHGKLFSMVQRLLKMSNIQRLSMRDLTFVYVNQNYAQPKRTAIKNLSVDLSGLSARETDSGGKSKTWVRVRDYRVATRDSLYHLSASDIAFSPQMRRATIKRLELNPRLSRKAFYEKVNYAKERIYLLNKNVSINGIDIDRLLQRQQLHIGSLNVGYSLAEVYTNYNYPRRLPKFRSNPYPSQQLQLLAFDVRIDTMSIRNSDAYFKVLAMKSDKLSSLDINNCSVQMYNITNNKDAIAANKFMTAFMRYKMMAAAESKAEMKFNLADKDGAFSSTVRMGSIDATLFNRFSRPYALMAVKSGTINRMYFHIDGNEYSARGRVDLYYKDMKYAVLKKDDETKEIKERKLVSALSNMMLPNDNPTKGGKFKKGPINIKRPANMSFFGLLSKAMLDGMTSSTTGLEQHKEVPESNIIMGAGEAITGGSGKIKDLP